MKSRTDEELPGLVARRSWIIFILLLLLSLFWRSLPVTLGVFCGGALALASFYWLRSSLLKMFVYPDRFAARRFQFGYLLRLASVAVAVFVLVAVIRVQPLAMAVGLSVVVLSLLWTAIERFSATGGPDS